MDKASRLAQTTFQVQKLPTAKQEQTFTRPKDSNQTNSQGFHSQFK